MPTTGYDSEFAPTPGQVQAAKARGVTWWGLYVYGSAASRIWSTSEADVLKQGQMEPLPICVPDQSFTEDPGHVADNTIAACQARGILSGGVVLDAEHSANQSNLATFRPVWNQHIAVAGYLPVLYNGPHLNVLPPTWEPIPSTSQPTPGTNRAIQWGSTTVDGLSVDVNVADPGFPLGSWTPNDPPAQEQTAMPAFVVTPGTKGAPQENTFDVTPGGVLRHRWRDNGVASPSWNVEDLASGLDPTRGPAVEYGAIAGQLEVFADRPDGSQLHMWYVAGAGWGSEVL